MGAWLNSERENIFCQLCQKSKSNFPLISFHVWREQQGVQLPEVGRYGTGIFFMDKGHHEESEGLFAELARESNLKVCQNQKRIYEYST